MENRTEPVRSNGPQKFNQRLRFKTRDSIFGGGRNLITTFWLLPAATAYSGGSGSSFGAASFTASFTLR
uniref:Uncharacterized protein n=1 Tax=Cannabis sativa TaxID=3483 RepID=A0A803R7B1_CANSA